MPNLKVIEAEGNSRNSRFWEETTTDLLKQNILRLDEIGENSHLAENPY